MIYSCVDTRFYIPFGLMVKKNPAVSSNVSCEVRVFVCRSLCCPCLSTIGLLSRFVPFSRYEEIMENLNSSKTMKLAKKKKKHSEIVDKKV